MSLFNQAHYYTNYCVFSVGKCSYKDCCIVFRDSMTLVKHDQILSSFNQAYYCTNYCVISVGKCYYKDLNYCFQRFYDFGSIGTNLVIV